MKIPKKEQKILDKLISSIPRIDDEDLCYLDDEAWDFLNSKLTCIGSGSFRSTFGLSRDFVLKVANCGDGIEANVVEFAAYLQCPKNKAKCYIVPNTANRLLVMERVKKTNYFENLHSNYEQKYYKLRDLAKVPKIIPKWIRDSEDRWQIGYNKKGKLVAYDYHL